MSNGASKLVLSTEDYNKLSALVASCKADSVAGLEEEIGRATILPQGEVPPDVVTMNSVVRVLDSDTGSEHEYTLVFPHEANAEQKKISVLAPLGVALIGQRTGQEYACETPNHRLKYFTVVSIGRAKAPALSRAR